MALEVRVAERAALVDALVQDFAAEAARGLRERERFAVALPGGSVAVNCFPALSRLDLDWRLVHFFWIDERAVPPEDPESNVGLARSLWFGPAGVPDAQIHRMPADGPDLRTAAVAYARELTSELGSPVRLDYALLGVGPDGHVASLFPGHADLADEGLPVAAVSDSPKPPARRLTLTMPVLAGAARVVVAAFGASKADALHDAIDQPDARTPLADLLRRARRALVLADPAAGGRLERREPDGRS